MSCGNGVAMKEPTECAFDMVGSGKKEEPAPSFRHDVLVRRDRRGVTGAH